MHVKSKQHRRLVTLRRILWIGVSTNANGSLTPIEVDFGFSRLRIVGIEVGFSSKKHSTQSFRGELCTS